MDAMWRAIAAAPLILVVTATNGFRHDSIPVAERVIEDIAARTRWFTPVFARTEDEAAAALAGTSLTRFSAVMFVNTTGDLPGSSSLTDWVKEGGSFVGVHSAADTWHNSPQYIEMLGAEFLTHPAESEVEISVVAPHPTTQGLESPHRIFEEIYEFSHFDPDNVHLLLRVGPKGPIAWEKRYGAGRVFYTALGHREDVWTSQWFEQHITGAIAWALQRDVKFRRRAVQR